MCMQDPFVHSNWLRLQATIAHNGYMCQLHNDSEFSIYLSIFICSMTNYTAQQCARTVEQDEQALTAALKWENKINVVTSISK